MSSEVLPGVDPKPRLQWNPRWAVERRSQTSVQLTAGTDRVVVIDGMLASDLDVLDRQPVDVETDCSPELVAHLLEMGVLTVAIAAEPSVPLYLDMVGGPAVSAVLAALGDASRYPIAAGDDDAFLVVVRRGPVDQTVPTIDASRPRLIVDIGAQHTAVFGPFVVPGRSACETCLDRLHARRWSTVAQPEVSGVTDHLTLLAALLDRHVELIAAGKSPLINATIATDVDTMTSRRESLLMSPGCPTCGVPRSTGRLGAVLEEP